MTEHEPPSGLVTKQKPGEGIDLSVFSGLLTHRVEAVEGSLTIMDYMVNQDKLQQFLCNYVMDILKFTRMLESALEQLSEDDE